MHACCLLTHAHRPLERGGGGDDPAFARLLQARRSLNGLSLISEKVTVQSRQIDIDSYGRNSKPIVTLELEERGMESSHPDRVGQGGGVGSVRKWVALELDY